VVCFSVSVREGPQPYKDTLRNIEATSEFVVNIVSEELAAAMNKTAQEVSPEVDEFELSGLTPIASERIRPPRVAESKAQMECSLRQILRFGDRPGSGILIFGDVVRFHVQEDLLDGVKVDPGKLNAVGRMGGPLFVCTRDCFELPRPK
jgi:flavin reductase (DIM6/NTAB) family NADH-FMN oxidoreductase RutF